MSRPTMTHEIAWAAATDAGNRHMKEHGRLVWDESDKNAAVGTYNRLMDDLSDTIKKRAAIDAMFHVFITAPVEG